MIDYPYLPAGYKIKYIGLDNQYMRIARDYAFTNSLDKNMPNAVVIVKDNKIIGLGANGSNYHDLNGCERIKKGIPTGEGYELCEGCHPKNHGESKAINDAKQKENDTNDASIYLWGHWWCCKDCWDKMISANIKNLFLLIDSEKLFNKLDKDNIVGHQFDNLMENNKFIN